LIPRKSTEIVATRCHVLKLKCTKFDFFWGSTPDPAGEAYSAPPDPLARIKGPTSKGRKYGKEEQGKEEENTVGKGGKERKGRERKERGRGKGCVMAVGG